MKTKKVKTDKAFMEKAKTITFGTGTNAPAPKICGGCLHDIAAFAAGAVMAEAVIRRHRTRHPKASGEEAFAA